jgi:hypothetical protein
MQNLAKIITITIEESTSGLFFATCDKEPSFFVSALSRDDMQKIIPIALKNLFHKNEQLDVMIFNTEPVDKIHEPWMVVPTSLIAAQYQANQI